LLLVRYIFIHMRLLLVCNTFVLVLNIQTFANKAILSVLLKDLTLDFVKQREFPKSITLVHVGSTMLWLWNCLDPAWKICLTFVIELFL